MTVIAQAATPRRRARSRFTFDRLEVLGPLFILPAILYVVVLVGLPFLLALYYSVSAYSIFNPSYTFVGLKNFREVIDSEIFRRTLANTLIFTISAQIIGLLLGKIGAMLLMQEFPGRRHCPRAYRSALGSTGVTGDAGLVVDVQLALQRHQLDAGRGRIDRCRKPAAMAGARGSWR